MGIGRDQRQTPTQRSVADKLRNKYGREFYRLIGKKGGIAVRRLHGREHYVRIGQMGGKETSPGTGAGHYARIARLREAAARSSTEQGMR